MTEYDEGRALAWEQGYWLGINGHTGPGNPYRDHGETAPPKTLEVTP